MAVTETGLQAWLRYAPLPIDLRKRFHPHSKIIALSSSQSCPIHTAGTELQAGIRLILGQEIEVISSFLETPSPIIIGTVSSYKSASGNVQEIPELKEDGFFLSTQGGSVLIIGENERGALYGTFQYLSMLAQGDFAEVAYATNPSGKIRWVNEWDNLDGSIERGYAGKSFFFKDGKVLNDLTRAAQYARLLASIRINGIVVVRIKYPLA